LSGDERGLYRITARPQGPGKDPARKAELVKEVGKSTVLPNATAIWLDSMHHVIALTPTKPVMSIRLSDGVEENYSASMNGVTSVCGDVFGRYYFAGSQPGAIWAIPRPGAAPVEIAKTETNITGLIHDPAKQRLLFTNAAKGTIETIPDRIPGWEVDQTPLPLEPAVVWKDVTWTGWDSGEDTGRVIPLRPIVLTHAGDGSGRTFVATQHGVIHIMPKDGEPRKTKVFLDLSSKVFYRDNENEQGLLGLAFHPKFKQNGELFVFYTDKAKRFNNVISRFRVSKTDPNVVDPNSEEELMRVTHKFWNHDGGTVCFGPDGFLYIVLGDGGSGNDPDDNGQNLKLLLGKILRIDVDRKDAGLAYGIPKDNPFVGKSDARPEIYALGVRNPWRLAFDRMTGQGWFGEVGQNLWEEINLLEKGANYGWRRRESLHPFGADGVGVRAEYTEPIWEYHHSVGKSITGGPVYRGRRLPELDGHYLYVDYVSGKTWALKYDESKKRVVANRPIKDFGSPIMSFGEDEAGEVYLLTYSAKGTGITRFERSSTSK
jgi:glucose/arabinose dehydrogenase